MISSRSIGAVAAGVMAVLCGSAVQAAAVLDFEDAAVGAQFAGDGFGSAAGPFLIDGVPTTFITQGVAPNGVLATSSFGLGISTGGTDPDPGSFNVGESWSVSADRGLSFLGVDFGGIQAEERASIRCNAWIGLSGISPLSPDVIFNPGTGTFTFTDFAPAGRDIFDLVAMTGGAPLPVPAGSILVFSLVSSTFGPNDDIELSSITVAAGGSGLDFGDAPDPPFPTLLASNGATHGVLDGYHLGTTVDSETDGQPSAQAGGDGADEDGIAFTSQLRLNVLPVEASVGITASAAGKIDAWIDFNQDGDWLDAGEQIFSSESLAAGLNARTFDVPTDAELGCLTFARFRFSSPGGLGPAGAAADGEVEDYPVAILPDADLEIFNTSITEDTVFTAANSIHAGGNFVVFPDTSILAPANVVFHAANRVVLENGVFVAEGASLTIKVGPVLTCP